MSFLHEVVASRRRDVTESKQRTSLDVLRSRIPVGRRGFAAALRRGTPAVIAEIKGASPSAGHITKIDAARLAAQFERAGASAISVVTEPRYFYGDLSDVASARSACSLPILRKDFIVDEYQVVESAAAGADAVLLIAAALDQSTLRELRLLAESLGLCALVEIHDEAEAARAVEAGATVIGINNRDLNTLAVDLTVAPRVRSVLPRHITVVAESGYQSADQLNDCVAAGFDAVLVGEALLRAPSPEAALRSLRGVPA